MVSSTRDPALMECPDFTSEEYAEVRESFVDGTVTEMQAAQMLRRVWAANQKFEVTRWNRRLEEEAVEVEADIARRAEEAARRLVQEAEDREELRWEDRKKNPSKFVPIPDRLPPILRPEIVALYAQRRMDKGLYCEVYYFTAEGLDAAKKVGAYVDESMVPITDGTGGMTWISAIAKREPGSFKEDQELTWEEFSGAVPHMLLAM
ncbi:hypothetical protein M422DRAFT_153126, partial [Sphaerobolus stellatus SS14]